MMPPVMSFGVGSGAAALAGITTGDAILVKIKGVPTACEVLKREGQRVKVSIVGKAGAAAW